MRLSRDGIFNALRLCEKGQAKDGGQHGWAEVSNQVWPLVEAVPEDLMARVRDEDGGGKAGLTAEGQTLLKWDRYFATCPKTTQP